MPRSVQRIPTSLHTDPKNADLLEWERGHKWGMWFHSWLDILRCGSRNPHDPKEQRGWGGWNLAPQVKTPKSVAVHAVQFQTWIMSLQLVIKTIWEWSNSLGDFISAVKHFNQRIIERENKNNHEQQQCYHWYAPHLLYHLILIFFFNKRTVRASHWMRNANDEKGSL